VIVYMERELLSKIQTKQNSGMCPLTWLIKAREHRLFDFSLDGSEVYGIC